MKNRATNELTVCGQKAVDKLAKTHPESVKRLFFNQDAAPRYGALCKQMAASRRIYRLVDDTELEKLAGSVHHGGVAAVIDLPRLEEPGPLEIGSWIAESRRLLFLDHVANSHNLGTMVRTAAFLGVKDIVVSGGQVRDDHLMTSSMYRTAEGGMELVRLWKVPHLPEFIDRFASGITFVAADHRAKDSLRDIPARLPPPGKAVAVVLGNEENGLSPEVRSRCQLAARIPGTGQLDSLNVAQAAAIFLFTLG